MSLGDESFGEEGTSLFSPPNLFITANRVETQIDNIGRSIDVREAHELEQHQTQTLTDSVQNVSGVRMFDLGGPGAPGVTPIEIRGVRTGGTQLLLNGLVLNDPSGVTGTFDAFFPALTINDIERIEILKGGTGVLYGSDGQGGVINLITKSPKPGLFGGVSFEGGSYDTYTESASANAGTERGGLFSSVTRIDSGGLDTHGNYENTTLSLIGEYEVIPDVLSLSPVFRAIGTETDLDTNPSLAEDGSVIPNQDTEKNNSENAATHVALTGRFTPNDWIDVRGSVYYNDIDRDFFFDFDGFESTSEFLGESLATELQSTFEIPALLSALTAGVKFEHQESDTTSDDFEDSAQRDIMSIFLYNQMELLDERLQLAGGVRLAEMSDLDLTISKLELSGVFHFPGDTTRLHSSIAQGFRAPTLFESQGNIADFDTGGLVHVGNKDLEEEESLSWDAGLTQDIFSAKDNSDDRLSLDVTFFQIDADQTILFDFANFSHFNGGGGKTQGIESALFYQPCPEFYLRGSYTNLDRAEGLDGERRQRTPKNWFALSGVTQLEKFTVSAELRFRDSQEIEFFGIEERAEEDEVTVFDAAVTYQVTRKLQLYVRADNVFDVDYTEAGFHMPGASIYGGFRMQLGS